MKVMFDTVAEVISDLKKGRVVIVCDDKDRENEGDFLALADRAVPETINFMSKYGRGLVCTPITQQKAQDLQLDLMVKQNSDPYKTAFTISVDHHSTTTGIAAFERARTISELANPDATSNDFKKPGHIFPLIAKEDGVLERSGHTEAAVDLAKQCDVEPAGVICEIMNEDGAMARVPDLRKIADRYNLKMITIADLIAYRKNTKTLMRNEVETTLPTVFGRFQAIGFQNQNEGQEHVALIKGDIRGDEPVLVRVHSECLTGDVFGSLRCDCGAQLHEAMSQIEAVGSGLILYMRQEGRGIGLLNKLRAYKLQEKGYDTVEANRELGFAEDCRDYDAAAAILQDLGIHKIRLLTNNPQKINGLNQEGLEIVERISLQTPPTKDNEKYLRTKHDKMGHLLHI